MLAGMVFEVKGRRFGFMLGSKQSKSLKTKIMNAINPWHYEEPRVVVIRPRDALGRFVSYKQPKQIAAPVAAVQDYSVPVPPAEGGLS